jgi:hypothetical protein
VVTVGRTFSLMWCTNNGTALPYVADQHGPAIIPAAFRVHLISLLLVTNCFPSFIVTDSACDNLD